MDHWKWWLVSLFIFDVIIFVIQLKVVGKSQSKSLTQHIWPTVYAIVIVINFVVGGLVYNHQFQQQQKAFNNRQHAQYERVAQPVRKFQQRQNYLLNQMRKHQDNTIQYRQLQIQYYRNNNELVIARDKLQIYRQVHAHDGKWFLN